MWSYFHLCFYCKYWKQHTYMKTYMRQCIWELNFNYSFLTSMVELIVVCFIFGEPKIDNFSKVLPKCASLLSFKHSQCLKRSIFFIHKRNEETEKVSRTRMKSLKTESKKKTDFSGSPFLSCFSSQKM